MELWEEWFQEKQVERTIRALKKNHFEAFFVPDSKAALDEVMRRIPDEATVAVGGSQTLREIGFLDAIEKRKVHFIWPSQQAQDIEAKIELIRKTFFADFFLSSTNAVTEDGKLFNIDGIGNRVGAMLIGPKQVIVICGVNKIVKDIEAAEKRLKEWAAPQNAKRINRKPPCTETGVCSDCNSPERICNVYVTIARKPGDTKFAVILVGEKLGI